MKAQRQIGKPSWIGYCASGVLALAVVLPLAWIWGRYFPAIEDRRKVYTDEVDLIDLASGTASEEMLKAQRNIYAWRKLRAPELLFMPHPVLGFTLGVMEKNYAPDLQKGFQHSFSRRCEDLHIDPYRGHVCQIPERNTPEVFSVEELSSFPAFERTWKLDFQAVEPSWTVPVAPKQDGIVWCDALGRSWQKASQVSLDSEALRDKARGITRMELIQGQGMPRRVVVRESCGIGELDRQAVQALLYAKLEEVADAGNASVYVYWNSHCMRIKETWSY